MTDVYDPAHFNDRLLLGLKGTMSEAELHVLRARLRGGIVNKARRGELEMPPADWLYLRCRGARASRPRCQHPGEHSAAVPNLSAHRLCFCDREGVS